MTVINEILITANQLANQGKKPTVALIKAKLSQPAPLPTIISTLKSWQHQPDFISLTEDTTENESDHRKTNVAVSENEEIKKLIQETLNDELAQMKKELSELKDLIKDLSIQLKQN